MPRTTARILVIVSPEHTAVETVEYALREARDVEAELDEPAVVTVLLIDRPDARVAAGRRGRIETMLAEFESRGELEATMDVLSIEDEGSIERTEAVLTNVDVDTISRVVVDSRSNVSVEGLRETFGISSVEIAPGKDTHSRRRLVHSGGVRRLVTIFGLTYLFYLAIGGFTPGLDLLTGAISAGVVALSLSHVALREEPKLGRTGGRLVRMALFVPALLWEIVKANFGIAYVILHPRLPIDPSMGTLDTGTEDGLERMVLANSISLTPGTLTVDVRGAEFTIHSLTSGARGDLEGGRLERLVAWVFHGRRGARSSTDGGEPRD